MAVAFPLAVLLVFAVTCWRRRSLSSVLIAIFGLYVSTYAALAAFTLSLTVRGQSHGLLALGALLRDDRIPRFIDPTQWVVAIQLLVSSVTASVPITELSVARAPSARLLLLNANPLPSQFLNLDTFDQERLWPFAWIPLSMVGEWYGATGALGQVALFFLISLIAAVGVAIGMTSRNPLVVAVVLGMSSIVLVMSIQYPSRSFWRGVSLLILATLVAYFWNKFSATSRGGLAHPDHQPRNETTR
ncbi:hypothetical protein [Pseudarthrobacter siccitolerans]|nr:hypothetical protein [Pseudarthrobacter siccitolerans]